MADYSLLRTALSGLQAAQAGMMVTSQNVSGSAVEGFSRRRSEVTVSQYSLDLRSAGGSAFAVEGFSRDYSRFLEAQRGVKRGEMMQADALVKGTSTLDAVVIDSASSVGNVLDKFFAAAGALARDDGNVSYRAQFFGAASQLVERINGFFDAVNAVEQNAEISLSESLQTVNRLAKQLAVVNEKLSEGASNDDSSPRADLLDSRDQLLMALQDEVGGQSVVTADGMGYLYVNGQPVVDRNGPSRMTYKDGQVFITLGDSPNVIGGKISLEGSAAGRASGNFSLVDQFVPELKKKIAEIAEKLTTRVNEALEDRQTGVSPKLFSYAFDGNSLSFRIDPDLNTTTTKVSVSQATAIESLRQPSEGVINDWARFTTFVGGQIASWKADFSASDAVSKQLDLDREKISGVNLDEEAANLVQFQQLYGASSKVFQVGIQLFETLLGIMR